MKFQGASSYTPRSGRGGRRFKSCHSDQYLAEIQELRGTVCGTVSVLNGPFPIAVKVGSRLPHSLRRARARRGEDPEGDGTLAGAPDLLLVCEGH